MRLHSPALLFALTRVISCGASDAPRKYEVQPAFEFLFQRQQVKSDCLDRIPGQMRATGNESGAIFVASSNEAPYSLTRSEELILSSADAPALTITADPSNNIFVSGSDRSESSMRFCARGDGDSEADARESLRQVSMTRTGSLVSINRRGPVNGRQTMSSFLLEAPANTPTVIHASYAPVEVRDMSGPVRITASHARAKILGTTEQVDAEAFVIDYAGSRGKVTLSAEAEINLRMTACKFEGTLLAWAQRPVRMLVPFGFVTPFQAVVNRSQDFVCRADFCSNVKHERKNGLYVFTYAGDGSAAPERVHLRSEQSTVVIDNVGVKN